MNQKPTPSYAEHQVYASKFMGRVDALADALSEATPSERFLVLDALWSKIQFCRLCGVTFNQWGRNEDGVCSCSDGGTHLLYSGFYSGQDLLSEVKIIPQTE